MHVGTLSEDRRCLQSPTSNHLKERPAMRADEIDLCDLHEGVAQALGCRQRRGTAGMTLT